MRVSVPINFAFTTPFRQAGLIFFFWCKKKKTVALKHKGITVSLAQPQQEEAFFSPWLLFAANGGRTGRAGKLYTAKEKELADGEGKESEEVRC